MATFQDRQQCLLLQLSAAERQHGPGRAPAPPPGPGELDRRTYRRLRGEMRQFRGQESIFKRPEAPLSRCLRTRRAPAPPSPRGKDPRKWVHYSLEDVSAEDMSDATNTATALALIREMERRNLDATPMICDTPDRDVELKKPTFCISATIKKKCDPDPPAVTFRNSRLVMPEYVVGVTEKKGKKKKTKKEESGKKVELKLEHLYEDDD